MKSIQVEELKRIQLDILKSIDIFCSFNNIHYSLAFGSLLGAVRHGGYIPWDDDLDIMLCREDYMRFIQTYKDNNYKVVDLSSDVHYELPFAKVYDTRTKMDEYSMSNNCFGVYVDVFPVDYVPDNMFKRNLFLLKKNIWNVIYDLKVVRVDKRRNCLKNCFLFLSQLILRSISIRKIAKILDYYASKYSHKNCSLMGILAPSDNKKREIFPSRIFNEYITMSFEDFDAMVIKMYDEYLAGSYGNYMKLPSIEKQKSHHIFKAWRCE